MRRLAAIAALALVLAVPERAWSADCLRADTFAPGWAGIRWTEVEGLKHLKSPMAESFRSLLADLGAKAGEFYRKGGYPAPSLCVERPLLIYDASTRDEQVVSPTAGGYYLPPDGRISLSLPNAGIVSDFLQTKETTTGETLTRLNFFEVAVAHEIFHAIQHGRADIYETIRQGGIWVVEGTANAAGFAFARSRGYGEVATAMSSWRPEYDMPLHWPGRDRDPTFRWMVNEAERLDERSVSVLAPYSRGHFFFHMGKDLGFPDGAGWLAEDYTAAVNDAAAGLGWLDGLLKRRGKGGLAEYLPVFVARHAATRDAFSSPARNARPWKAVLEPGRPTVHDGTVRAVAAEPVRVELTIPAGQGDLFLVEQRLSRIDEAHGRMVVDGEVVDRGRPWRRILPPGDAAWFTRIVNVDPKSPIESIDRAFRLELEAYPIDAGRLCVRPGDILRMELAEPAASAVAEAVAAGDMRWRIDGVGAQPEGVLRAPDRVGRTALRLEVRTDRGWRSHRVGEIDVRRKGCMIRMIAGGSHITYVPDGDYTEFRDPRSGEAIYFGDRRIKMSERGAWLDLPPEAEAMILGGISANLPLQLATEDVGALPDGVNDPGMAIHRLPHDFWKRLSWSNLRKAGLAGIAGKAVRREPAPCPDGTRGCASMSFNPAMLATKDSVDTKLTITLLFDETGHPLKLDFGEEAITFEVGDFNVARPPGW